MKRMYSLDLLKLVLAYVVAFFHVGIDVNPGSTVAVQIFFIISGFFLARKFCARRGSGYGPWDYTWDHVKSLYPHYLFSLGMIFLYLTARAVLYFLMDPSWQAFAQILTSIYDQIPDLLLLQSSVHFHNSMNYPLWQISALLISGYFVYALLDRNEKTARTLIFPAAILMIQSLLNTGVDLWANYGPFYLPLLRAFGPMCIGVLTWYFTGTDLFHKALKYRKTWNLFSVLALVSIFTFSRHDVIFLVTTPLVILACTREDSWISRFFSHSCFRWCGNYSYAIYLNHALIQRVSYALVFPRLERLGLPLNTWQQGVVYFVLLSGYSVLTLWLVGKGKALLSRSRQ